MYHAVWAAEKKYLVLVQDIKMEKQARQQKVLHSTNQRVQRLQEVYAFMSKMGLQKDVIPSRDSVTVRLVIYNYYQAQFCYSYFRVHRILHSSGTRTAVVLHYSTCNKLSPEYSIKNFLLTKLVSNPIELRLVTRGMCMPFFVE